MKKFLFLLAALLPLLLLAQAPASITWDAAHLPAISRVLGKPSVLNTRLGYAAHFNGAICKIRVTSAALSPDQFLKDHEELNK